MYIRTVLAACRRRWPVMLVLLALCAGLCWGVAQKIQPTYDATASIVLVPPKDAESPETNRYLLLGSLNDSVAVLARSMQSAETVDALEDAAPNAAFTIAQDVTTSAPILQLSVTAADEADAAAMVQALKKRVGVNLLDLQKDLNIAPENQISTVVLSTEEPAANQKDRLRLLAVIASGLLFLSAVLVVAVDGLLLRRRQRAQDRDDQAEDQEEDQEAAASEDDDDPTRVPSEDVEAEEAEEAEAAETAEIELAEPTEQPHLVTAAGGHARGRRD